MLPTCCGLRRSTSYQVAKVPGQVTRGHSSANIGHRSMEGRFNLDLGIIPSRSLGCQFQSPRSILLWHV